MNKTQKRRTLAVSLLAVFGFLMVKKSKAQTYTGIRGVRNNNPLNVRRMYNVHGQEVTPQWQGMKSTQTDPGFVQFINNEYGIRAAYKILQTYNSRGIDTIDKIINTWAPAADGNNPQNYILTVIDDLRRQGLNIYDDDFFNVYDLNLASKLLYSMAAVEVGKNNRPDYNTFVAAWSLL